MIGLVTALACLIGLQTVRVIRRDRRLRVSNEELFAVNQDLEAAKKAAEQSSEASEHANLAKSVFLANMSHEIRTPMNAVLGYAQILQGDPHLTDEQRKAVDTIDSSGQYLLGLINDVLDISKIEAGHEQLNLTDFDLQGMLQDIESLFAVRCAQKGLVWAFTEQVRAGVVYGDEGKLRQVLINLLGNAVKFTDDGQVGLTVQEQEGGQVRLEVTDTGPGIPQEQQASVFDPFQQEEAGMRQGGTGLGLAIAQRYVRAMGGDIELASSPGSGSRFSFTVPLPAGIAPSESQAGEDWSRVSRLAEGSSVRALVVDDVATNRDILARMLTHIGVEVYTAEGGARALDLLSEAMPDIVFMDIRMPQMDGPETLRRLRERHGRDATVVVAVTASVFDHERQQHLETGFDGFMDKPLRSEQVYACLSEHLGVNYTYTEAAETRPAADVDWSHVVLPSKLHADLTSAVDDHSITQVRQHLGVLKGLGDREQSLEAYLTELAQQYDIEGIRAVLSQIRHA